MIPLQLDNFPLASSGPTLVIAEIGVNHDGQLDRAIELVHSAAQAGANAVKLQIFTADRLMHASSEFADYQKASTGAASPADMLRKYQLGGSDLNKLVGEIRRCKLIPLATPFSPEDVEQIESLHLPAIKIASPDLVNWPLLYRAAAANRPLLISTGAASLNEISSTVGWLREWRVRYALLHCISSYPTPTDAAHLCWIGELAARFEAPIGYSDHTTEIAAGALAVAAGACIIEKHLTHDCNAQGPDHSASFDPPQFAQYVRMIRLAEQMRGQSGKKILDIERDVRTVSRQSIVAARDIHQGQIIQSEDLTVQRPGTGVPASELPSLVGRRASRFIKAGQLFTRQFLSDAA